MGGKCGGVLYVCCLFLVSQDSFVKPNEAELRSVGRLGLALSPCGSEPHRPRGLQSPVHVGCLKGRCVAETVTSSIVKGHCLLRD